MDNITQILKKFCVFILENITVGCGDHGERGGGGSAHPPTFKNLVNISFPGRIARPGNGRIRGFTGISWKQSSLDN